MLFLCSIMSYSANTRVKVNRLSPLPGFLRLLRCKLCWRHLYHEHRHDAKIASAVDYIPADSPPFVVNTVLYQSVRHLLMDRCFAHKSLCEENVTSLEDFRGRTVKRVDARRITDTYFVVTGEDECVKLTIIRSMPPSIEAMYSTRHTDVPYYIPRHNAAGTSVVMPPPTPGVMPPPPSPAAAHSQAPSPTEDLLAPPSPPPQVSPPSSPQPEEVTPRLLNPPSIQWINNDDEDGFHMVPPRPSIPQDDSFPSPYTDPPNPPSNDTEDDTWMDQWMSPQSDDYPA